MPIGGRPPVVVLPTAPVIVGEYSFQLQRAGETPFVLNESVGLKVQLGAQGLDDPTLDFSENVPAGWDGALVDQIAAEPREVFLPLLMESDSLMGLRALKQSMMAYLNPRRGPVTLRVGLPDGTARLIDGYYRPVPWAMDADTWWVKRQKLGIVIRCGQPFFRSEVDWTVEWNQSVDPAALLPWTPVAPADSNALNATNPVRISGDVETYPVWYITGPLESVEILDVGTGRSFLLTASIGSGETWVVDTRRGQQAVYDNAGVRQRATLNPGAQLWPLQPGISQIQTTVTGASAGAQVRGEAPILWLAA
jgi:hypothetical protein